MQGIDPETLQGINCFVEVVDDVVAEEKNASLSEEWASRKQIIAAILEDAKECSEV